MKTIATAEFARDLAGWIERVHKDDGLIVGADDEHVIALAMIGCCRRT